MGSYFCFIRKGTKIMTQFLDALTKGNSAVNNFIWTTLGLVLLLGTGLITTAATKAFQLSRLRLWWRSTAKRRA